MRAVVNQPLNVRIQTPGVNAPITRFHERNDIVDVTEAVIGDPYDGDDMWYKLRDGSFVWAGAIDVDYNDMTIASRDKSQFLISYRTIKDGKPNLDSRDSPSELYFARVTLPVNSDNVLVNKLEPVAFAGGVVDSIANDERKHVIIYIHGYQIISSLKLDLFTQFVQNYSSQPGGNIARMIFMTWPCYGLGRKHRDDEAVDLGEQFTIKKLFNAFAILSQRLREKGKTLSLVVHSFGNHLLNGMVNPAPAGIGRIFDNIFLMAPDITYLAASVKGASLPNIFKSRKGRDRITYAYANLLKMSTHVHVFYDKFDFLLYISTRKSLDKDNWKNDKNGDNIDAKEFRILGNYGSKEIMPTTDMLPFNYVDVADLVDKATDFGNLLYFPFRRLRDKSIKQIDDAIAGNYKGMNTWSVLWNVKRFPDHHRYLFTCKPVVDEVIRLLNKPLPPPGGPAAII